MSIFNYEVEILEGNEWKQINPWMRPFHDGNTLDESLDFGQIIIVKTDRREPFAPFTPLRIGVYEVPEMNMDVMKMSDEEKAQYRVDYIYRLVSDTQVEQRGFAYNIGEDWYRHTINTIEYSKLLEREICDSITFTKYLSRDYLAGAGQITPDVIITGSGSVTDEKINLMRKFISFNTIPVLSPRALYDENQNPSSVVFLSFNNLIIKNAIGLSFRDDKYKFIVKNPSGQVQEKTVKNLNETFSISLSEEGDYEICYEFAALKKDLFEEGIFYFKVNYVIAVLDKIIDLKANQTIANLINRILSICPTRRKGIDKQSYTLDLDIAVKFAEIEAPEFHITRSTLWEALSQVGGYIHAIPRLVYPNIVTFDELGGSEEYIPPTELKCVCYSAGRKVDETCGALDSTVENFLCTEDLGQGAVTEPCSGGFKSVRCDEGQFVLSNDNALILTEKPIYRVVKVEVAKATESSWSTIGDITPYIFEEAEYKTLTSYGGTYPYSRSFALSYSQGDNKIKDFTFKQEAILNFCQAFEGTAIKNIIERIGGTCPTWYYDLAFRVTYIPMTSARVKQLKPYIQDRMASANTLLYNQSANTVESASYGENLKGTIARLGNTDEQRTYHFERYADLPKVGQIWDAKYIARVECEYEKQWIKATVTLTENFNRLAQYLGLHTNYRLYDVSEKQSVERQINYGEMVVIGDDADAYDKLSAGINEDGIALFAKTLEGHNGVTPIGNVFLRLTNENDEQINDVTMLPCTSVALGNSLAFSWKFVDNYGAGYKSSESLAFKRIQEIVPYGDVYGEFFYLYATLNNGLPAVMPPEMPYDLPKYTGSVSGLIDYNSAPFIIIKDSREQINMTVQLHFIANRRGIVIGSGLGQFNAMVSPDALETEIFFSDKRLNVFRPIFPLSEVGRKDFTVSKSDHRIALTLPVAPPNTKSWALVGVRRDKDGNVKSKQLIVGENIDGAARPVYFNFVSNKEVS